MKRFMIGFILGIMISSGIAFAAAKRESGSSDAKSIVGYGQDTATHITILKTTADGALVIN